ncbi:MAG: hypothetical protein ACRDT4_17645 [Micromonosporaceae bacterium]
MKIARRTVWVGAAVAVVLIVVAAWLVVARLQSTPSNPLEDPVLRDHLSGPGTPLPDGLTVAGGSSLVGPVVRTDAVPEHQQGARWQALAVVTGEPLEVWRSYLRQLAAAFPKQKINTSRGYACRPKAERHDGFGCDLYVTGALRSGELVDANLSLGSVPRDVTGSYLLSIRFTRLDKPEDPDQPDPEPTYRGDPPAPQPARDRPESGDLISDTLPCDDDSCDDFPLLDGSELLVQYGTGSLTGGFDVLLAVEDRADLDRVVRGYVEQGTFTGGDTITRTSRHADDVVTTYRPPGGAGGFTAEITVVDRTSGPDYIWYELWND